MTTDITRTTDADLRTQLDAQILASLGRRLGHLDEQVLTAVAADLVADVLTDSTRRRWAAEYLRRTKARDRSRPAASYDPAHRATETSLDAAVRSLLTARAQLPATWATLEGQAATTRPLRSLWCWEHERDVQECHRLDLLCTGEAIDTHDPTGEAAIAADQARRDHAELTRLVGQLRSTARQFATVTARYLTVHRAPTAAELAATAQANEPGCALCAKVAAPGQPETTKAPRWWNEVRRTTDAGGILDTKAPLCHAHIRRITSTGEVPSKRDTAHYRDHGKWPATKG